MAYGGPRHPLRRHDDQPRKRGWVGLLTPVIFVTICIIIGMMHPAFIVVFVIGVISGLAMVLRA